MKPSNKKYIGTLIQNEMMIPIQKFFFYYY